MASNFFGDLFRITTFGESHGPAIGVVIDGCPAGIGLTKEEIDAELVWRKPGKSPFTSPRAETDQVEVLSGLFEGKTTGTPIALLIRNQDAKSDAYAGIQDLYRPGHGNFTYLEKYGVYDYRGGGRASGRETVARVAAGAVAKKLLARFQIDCVAFVSGIGGIGMKEMDEELGVLRDRVRASPIFCPDEIMGEMMMRKISEIKEEGDSLGGIVSCVAKVPIGLGDPVYGKLEAKLASAMLSIPASKGFEIGSGFGAARMKGSEHNDLFDVDDEDRVYATTNFAGGTLAGISNGASLFFRVAFKPPSSIKKAQSTVTVEKRRATLQLPEPSRHDPCVAIRATPVVEAMTALVLADALLMQQSTNRCS